MSSSTATMTVVRLQFTKTREITRAWCAQNCPTETSITRRQLAALLRHLCYWDKECVAEIEEGIRYMEEVQAPVKRPMLLVNEGDAHTPTLWLLGWRPCDATPIHDHDDSFVGVNVVRGSVREDIYPEIDSSRHSTREFYEGTVVTMGAPYIHRVRGDCSLEGMAVTLHGYFPKLDMMRFFEEEGNDLRLGEVWQAEEKAVIVTPKTPPFVP